MNKGDWYSGVLEAAQKAGIVHGVGGGRFAPGKSISREEMAVMVLRAYLYSKHDESIADDAKVSKASFLDTDSFSDWAIADVLEAHAAGLVSGIGDNMFLPKQGASREQMAAILIRFLDKTGKL